MRPVLLTHNTTQEAHVLLYHSHHLAHLVREGIDGRSCGTKDVNAPFPDSPRGILLLGDGDGESFFPTRMKMGMIHPPSGFTGAGMVSYSSSPFPHSPQGLLAKSLNTNPPSTAYQATNP
jgi:hypothetical protein